MWSRMLANQNVTYAQNGGNRELRMLRWMCGKTRMDKIRNRRFQEHLRVASIGDKIRKTRLRGFQHIQCRPATVSIRKSLGMQIDDPLRGNGGPKRTLMDVIKMDVMKSNLFEDLARDRSEWRNKIHVAEPSMVGTRL